VTFDCDPLLPPSYLYKQGDVNLELVESDEVMKILQDNESSSAVTADSQHSDLLPAVYEGMSLSGPCRILYTL
jgi:hypothetical protein